MDEGLWTRVDDYIVDMMVPRVPALDAALRASERAGLPPIQVSPAQGKMLHILARAIGARRILEFGTLGGYSAIWLARALPPDGRLITLEAEAKHAEVARRNIARAGLEKQVEVRVGPALETLPRLAAEGAPPFDFFFIDADKPGYPDYLSWCLRLARRGSLIVADNVVRGGAVADARTRDPMVQGIRRFNDLLATEPRLSATIIQTVGSKGYDGFALAVVTADPRAGPESSAATDGQGPDGCGDARPHPYRHAGVPSPDQEQEGG